MNSNPHSFKWRIERQTERLYRAAKSGDYRKMSRLLRTVYKEGSKYRPITMDTNPHSFWRIKRQTALFKAAKSGDYEKISRLLRTVYKEGLKDERYDAMKDALTPLHVAAINGHHRCLQILIDHGANVDERDNFTTTALHRAAENGNFLCVKSLLEAGADCNAPIFDVPLRNEPGRITGPAPYVRDTTALHLAVANNHIDCVEELVNFGAELNDVLSLGKTRKMAKALIRWGADISEIETHTLLRDEFCVAGEEDFFKCLVKRLPVLPRIGFYIIFSCFRGNLLGSTLPDNLEVAPFPTTYFVSMTIREKGFKSTIRDRLFLHSLREPLLGVIYNSVIAELEMCIELERENLQNQDIRSSTYFLYLSKLKKQLWYEQMASNPLTLQHCCRLTIRKRVSKLKLIKKLPLPELMISYLLYEQED